VYLSPPSESDSPLPLRMCSDAFAFPNTCIRQHTPTYVSVCWR
jgi:hypothetical protein